LKDRSDQNIATAMKTQMNFYLADWHDQTMTVVSNTKFNSVTSKIGRSLLCSMMQQARNLVWHGKSMLFEATLHFSCAAWLKT